MPPKRSQALKVDPQIVAGMFPARKFENLSEFEGIVDHEPIYFRDGSDKSKVGLPSNWQVTIPWGEPLGKQVKSGSGFLCFNRGPVYLVPMVKLKDWLHPKLGLQKPDIFFDVDNDEVRCAGLEPLKLDQFKASKVSKERPADE